MASWTWIAVGVGACAVVYAVAVLALVVAGRRGAAAALATFVPDCAVLVARLVRDPRVPRRHKLLLAGLAVYLASPIDLVPDFVPVAGQLDDAILLALVLRALVRRGGAAPRGGALAGAAGDARSRDAPRDGI